MSRTELLTERLRLTLPSIEETRAMLDALSPEEREQVSDEWIAMIRSADKPDPWIHGFAIARPDDGGPIGQCGFKGPPVDGVVEIAYAVEPEHQGVGYATEAAAAALAEFALAHGEVTLVCAHTLREPNASTRVLTQCGFRHVGEVVDPDDGPVWRWERERPPAS